MWIGENVLMTGGADKKICILNLKDLSLIKAVDCTKILKDSVKPSICSIDVW